MAKLTPVPFPDLVRRMRREVEVCRSIFDLPVTKWFFPNDTLDFSVRHLSGRASTPVGPAAGPHTQLAQNIVLSWLAGGRILELKTVQVNDNLEIPRPCIYIPNVGYNVEWSQELTVSESLLEYAKALYLIEILKQTRAFGAFGETKAFAEGVDTVFDTSVGYDLEGIRSEKVTGFLRGMQNPAAHFDALRGQLAGDCRTFRGLDLPSYISNCVSLSTFHGCPADQIEAIGRYLLEELGFHIIIKFNPTLLGFERVRELLLDRLGYRHLTLLREAFEQDLKYDDALEILRRLRRVADNCGRAVGAKFTNTLLVANNPKFFPTQTDPYMYLSGQPLHVIAMHLMHRVREEVGFELPVSFSAGIDRRNFAAAVACGMVPVTTCTDLLRQGGYARLPHYLEKLAEEMRRCGVSSWEAYVLVARGHGAEAVAHALRLFSGGAQLWNREAERLSQIAREHPEELPRVLRESAAAAGLDPEAVVLQGTRIAGRLNARDVVPALTDDPRYHARANSMEPRRVGRTLGLYDCINCDLCISACPNDAIFSYEATPVEIPTERLSVQPGGRLERTPGVGFAVRKAHQLAVVQSLCNECSNCDLYCPEHGAPYKVKEQVFLSVESFRSSPLHEGFCHQDGALLARLDGFELRFNPEPEHNRAIVRGQGFHLEMQWEPFQVKRSHAERVGAVTLDTALLWRIKTVWESIFHSSRPNMTNPDPPKGPKKPQGTQR